MKVTFTTKEYTRLLELVHLGLYVAGARPDDPNSLPARYAEISQKVFNLADQHGCAELVDTDAEGLLFASAALENGPAHEKLDGFIDDTFWSELASRLAERDLRIEARTSGTVPAEFSDEEEERIEKMESAYWTEFEANGVDRLFLLKGGQG